MDRVYVSALCRSEPRPASPPVVCRRRRSAAATPVDDKLSMTGHNVVVMLLGLTRHEQRVY